MPWEEIAGETGDWAVSKETYQLYLTGLAEKREQVVELLMEVGVEIASLDTDKWRNDPLNPLLAE